MIGQLAAAALLAGSPAAGASIDVATFLQKAEALQKRGPLALFSSDYKALKSAAEAAGAELKVERRALASAGKDPLYCPPERATIGSSELLDALRAVPEGQRRVTSLKGAMRAHFIRKWPCRR